MDRLRILKLFMMVLFVENSEEQRPYVEKNGATNYRENRGVKKLVKVKTNKM